LVGRLAPSAVVVTLRLRRRPEIARTIATQSVRSTRSFTKERSILISSDGTLWRQLRGIQRSWFKTM
jgi:hypothetical protein